MTNAEKFKEVFGTDISLYTEYFENPLPDGALFIIEKDGWIENPRWLVEEYEEPKESDTKKTEFEHENKTVIGYFPDGSPRYHYGDLPDNY